MGYTNEFNLEVGTTLNTSNIPKKLKELNAELQKSTSVKIPVTVTVNEKSGLTAIKNIYKEVNTYKDKIGNTYKQIRELDSKGNVLSDNLVRTSSALRTLTTETHKFTNTAGEIQKWTTSVDSLGKTVQTRTKQYIDDTNQLVTETSEWGRNAQGQWQQLGDTIQKTQEIVRESTTSTSTVKGQIDDLGKSYQGLITTTEKVGTNGEYLRTVVSKYTDEMGRAIVKTEQFDKAGKQVATTMRQIGDAAKDSSSAKVTFIDENGVKKVTQMVDGVKTLTTTTREYTSAQGALVKETKTLNEVTGETKTYKEVIKNKKQLAEESKKLQEQYRKEREERVKLEQGLVSSNTTQTRGKTKQFGDTSGREYDALITTLEKIDKNGQKTIQTTYEFINAQGKLVQQTRITDEEGKKLAQDTITIKDSISQATKAVEVLTTTTRQWGNSDGSVMKWTQTVDSAGNIVTKKVKEVVTGIGELTRTTQTAINGKNIGQAKTEIIEFADETQTSVNTVRGVINDLGKSYDGLITTTEKVSSNGEYLRTVVSKYTDETGRAVEVTDQFNKAGQKVATTMRKIGEAPQLKNTSTNTLINKDGTKIVTEYANGIAVLRTETKQYTDTLGQLIQETNVYDEQTHKLISTHKEELNNQKELLDKIAQEQQYKKQLTTTTREVEQSIQREGESYKAVVKTIQEETAEYGTLTTTITTYKNKLGEIVVETQKVNDKGQHVAQTTRTVTKELEKASNGAKKTSNDVKELGNSAEKANHGVKNLGWTLGDAISRLSNFYIASLPIRAVQTAITETIQTVKDFDSALIEFRKVSDLAGESLTNYVAKLAEMGEITGSTMQAMVEASTEFRKSGFSDEDSAQLASIAEKYRNIADEEISAGESASFIIAQMKAFNIEAGQAEHIIDSVNEVANNFSVSSADLAKNLGNMSEIMAINNVSMEEQIGMLTGVTEITRNASSASRGLVMISSRLTQVLDDTSSTGKKLTKIYNDLGIELKDENGQLRSHYDILGDLAGVWNTLSENQQKYIALTSAGARQQQNFVALMANWNQVAKATSTAYQSMGSAQKENEKVMDSIAKKVEILKSEFQQLVIGKGGLQDFAKTILDIGIGLLKFANSDIGKAIIQIGTMATAITLLTKGYKSLTSSLIENAKTITINSLVAHHAFTQEMAQEKVKTMALSDAIRINTKEFIANTKAILANPYTWIVTSIVAAIAITVKYNQVIKETNERIEEAKKTIAELTQEINLLEYAEKQEAGISKEEEDKLEYLNKRLELEKQILETKEKASNTREQLMEGDWVTDILSAISPILGASKTTFAAFGSDEAVNAASSMASLGGSSNKNQPQAWAEVDETTLGKYEQLRQEIEAWNDATDEGTKLLEQKQSESATYLTALQAERDELGKQRDTYAENNRLRQILLGYQSQGIPLTEAQKEKLKELTGVQEELNDRDKERLDVLENTIGKYQKNVEEITRFQEAIDEYGEGSEEADDILKDFAKDLGISETQLEANANALGLSIDAYYENAKAIKENDEALDYFQSALGTLQGAIDEYNESQYLSIDTIQSLLQLQPEYLAMLVDENGQLKLNEQAIVDKCNALIEEKKQTALQMAYDKLAAIERDNNSESAKNQASSIDGNTESLNIETAALSKNTVEQYANRIARNDKAKGTAASEVVRELERELAVLDKIGNNYTKISASAKKAGSAGKSAGKAATDAAKEAKKELEDLIKKYEQVIKYINKRYDREIKKIKDAKSEAVKAEEKKIKAVEKEKDHALDAIEKEIKALKKEQDARKKYWSDRIDALKKQNDALKDNLELQEKLDALEKARNTKVKIYKEGQGFVYDVDQTAVNKAQKELDEYLSQKAYEDELERLEALKDAELDNYEKRLDALNEYKDSVQENYEKQIEQMNEYKDQLSEQYDAQIDKWEEYKEQFGDLVDQYEEQQNKLLFEQLMGIKDENSNWLTRLDNLAEFVRKYNELQMKLNTGDTSVTNTAKMKEGTGGGSGSSNRKSSISPTPTKTSNWVSDKGGSGTSSGNQGYSSNALSAARKRVLGYASGTPSVKQDEIAVVGENPNQEIVIGSKINNGELMNLGKGTGVVNADSSKTLAGMLNQVGQFGASGFGSGNGTLNNNINNDSLVVNGVTIQGANIKDPETFVNGLLNMKAEAIQRAYRHR